MPAAPKTIVVTAAEHVYTVLAKDLVASLQGTQFKRPFDIGLIDLGIGDNNKKHFESLGVRVETARVDIEYPARQEMEAAKPGLRALTAQLFLRRYFPGYDVYIWLDADAWVQTPEAIETMIETAAQSQGVSIACEFDRCYTAFFESADTWHRFHEWYRTNFSPEITAAMALKPMLNVGVLAMRQDLPVWDAWAEIYTETLQKVTGLNDKSFMSHQLGLNILLYLKGLPCTLMPASYNWLTFFSLPMWNQDTKQYVEPLPPYRPISQIHLTRPAKNGEEDIRCLDGRVIKRKLTYSDRNI